MRSPLKSAFPPAIDDNIRLLVLGCLPGDASLAARQYYAHPTNQFWRLMEGVIGNDLTSLAYPERLSLLNAHGVGLWDVLKTGRRAGSLDSAIRDYQANDLGEFTRRLPKLRAVAFNGATAAKIGSRQMGADDRPLTQLMLPSSSAAYCSISFQAKQAQWLALRDHIGSNLA